MGIVWFLTRMCTRHKHVAMTIKSSPHLSELFLNLPRCYRNPADKKWCEIYHVMLILVSRMITMLRHNFNEEAINFVGIHQQRFLQCMMSMERGNSLSTSRGSLREIIHSTELLELMMRHFSWEMKFHMSGFTCEVTRKILLTFHASVAFLLHPMTLKTYVMGRHNNNGSDGIAMKAKRTRTTSNMKKQDDTDDLPEEVQVAQRGLVNITSNCLSYLCERSPKLCEIILDRTVDVDAYPRLLLISFGTPFIGDNEMPSFATTINAASFAYSTARKVKNNEEYSEILKYMGDMSLMLSMTQSLLYLKSPHIDDREKEVLKRELGDEMTSCARTELRIQRYYNSSPSTSPNTSVTSTTAGNASVLMTSSSSSSRNSIPELLQQFVKHVMR